MSDEENWHVIKRDGTRAPINMSEIGDRLHGLVKMEPKLHHANADLIAKDVAASLRDGITTVELDQIAWESAAARISTHPDYDKLAVRIKVTNIRKLAPKTFSEAMTLAQNIPLAQAPDQTYSVVNKEIRACLAVPGAKEALDHMIVPERDFRLDYFGLMTLDDRYLRRTPKPDRQYIETPQYFYLRVALAVFGGDYISKDGEDFEDSLDRVKKCYDLISMGGAGFATPTLLNSGMDRGSLSSCYLLEISSDSMEAITQDGMAKVSMLSKSGGGVAISMHRLRPEGSTIRGTDGVANGVKPLLRVHNQLSKYVDQGGGKRKGSFVVYFEAWHKESLEAFSLRTTEHKDTEQTDKLSYGLWIPDLFMKRLKAGGTWTLFCPDAVRCVFRDHHAKLTPEAQAIMAAYDEKGKHPDLCDLFGQEFEVVYEALEAMPATMTGGQTMTAAAYKDTIQRYQVETGYPYIQFKDAHNRTSNLQPAWGRSLSCSNLCVEIKLPTGIIPEEWIRPLVFKLVEIYQEPANKHTRHEQLRPILERLNGTERECLKNDCSSEVAYDIFASFIRRDPTIVSVCNLASMALPFYVKEHVNDCTDPEKRAQYLYFDFATLGLNVELMMRGLANVTERTYNPIPATLYANLLNRAVGLGVAGLADVFSMMRLTWDSEEAMNLQTRIAECMHYHQLKASMELAKERGHHVTYPGTHLAQGRTQPDLWTVQGLPVYQHGTYNLDEILKASKPENGGNGFYFGETGAWMPTATTANVLGVTESFEPRTNNFYVRETDAGNFFVGNRFLVDMLMERDLWTKGLADKIAANGGSVKGIPDIPEDIQKLFPTVWELKQSLLFKMAAARGPFITQTQSMNMYLANPTPAGLNTLMNMAWSRGLTGTYYLRGKSAAEASQTFAGGQEAPKAPVPGRPKDPCDGDFCAA